MGDSACLSEKRPFLVMMTDVLDGYGMGDSSGLAVKVTEDEEIQNRESGAVEGTEQGQWHVWEDGNLVLEENPHNPVLSEFGGRVG